MQLHTLFWPLVPLGLSIAVVLFGYWEMKKDGPKINGLTTWMFAAPPFAGSLLSVWYVEVLPIWVRFVLIGFLVGGASFWLSFLYRTANGANSSRG